MILYVAFDDTDTLDCGRGTGKLARWFAEKMQPPCSSLGVVRQQLLHRNDIPMTSHNSSLTVILDIPSGEWIEDIRDMAVRHIKENYFEGSDPGLCIVRGDSPDLKTLAEFGLRCTYEKVTIEDAVKAVGSSHLSGHGGTNMGMIGAAAGVGLTHMGDCGRYVEYKDVRYLPDITSVKSLIDRGIMVVSVNRHAEMPKPTDKVYNSGSLRPRLLNGRVMVPVISAGPSLWNTINEKAEY